MTGCTGNLYRWAERRFSSVQRYANRRSMPDFHFSVRKGSLPEGFITVDSLRNLCNNIADAKMARLFAQHSSISDPAFPVWFVSVLRRIYPEIFL